jgi:hypothetical protein
MRTKTMDNPFDGSAGSTIPFVTTVAIFLFGKIMGAVFTLHNIQVAAYIVAILNGVIAIALNPKIQKAAKKFYSWFKK